MRIIHTADWHLGQVLHGVPRTFEHARFLSWLIETLEHERADALLIAGDVFDAANPTPSAQQAYYGFLAECRKRLPMLGIVVIGGNHDSPQRLDAPHDILSTIDVSVVGGLPRAAAGGVDLDRVLIPLFDEKRSVGAWLMAVPFLRPSDLASVAGEAELEERAGIDDGGRLVERYRALHRLLLDSANERRGHGAAVIAAGHCYMVGGVVSELSERKIQAGNQYALPADIFPEELAYVALGHLHRAQSVGGRENVRYSGSPIPLSLAERTYEHQVLLVEIQGEGLRTVRSIPVPRAIEMMCVPEVHAPIRDVLEKLRALPRSGSNVPGSGALPSAGGPAPASARDGPNSADRDASRPYLVVRVELDSAHPRLRQDIEEALAAANAQLLRIDARHTRARDATAAPSGELLEHVSLEDVFRASYARQRPGPLPDDLLRMFHALVEDVEQARTSPSVRIQTE